MEKITFSIVTPSLNQGKFLGQAIESVISQRGDFYIEYIIADGGSSDDSVELIRKYDDLIRSGAHRISCSGLEYRWRSGKDDGQSAAIKDAFRSAKGQLFAWLNSDDYYEPGAFQKVAELYFNDSGADLYYGCCRMVNDHGESKPMRIEKNLDYKKLLAEGFWLAQPASFFTKKRYCEVGGLDEKLVYAMDYDLYLRLLKNGRSCFLPEDLARFRIWPESKSVAKKKVMENESETVRRKHGGRSQDPANINTVISNLPGIRRLKERFPRLRQSMKRAIDFIIRWL